MNIPSLPVTPIAEEKIINGKKNLMLHPSWQIFFAQLTNELQTNASNEGLVIPAVNTQQLNVLNTNQSVQRFIYDSDAGVMKVNNSGVYQQLVVL